jgi:ABC-type glycerol-3-phosphate transport system substrate-binding protein
MKKILIAVAALAAFGAAETTLAQGANSRDDTELLISQIQTDKRAIVLSTLQLTDPQVQAFTPIYDEYQRDMKDLMTRGSEVIDKFAANFGSMTDDAAKDILKDYFAVRDDRNDLMEKYAKKFQKALPATKVLQWVQVENKLNALLDVQAAAVIPISR